MLRPDNARVDWDEHKKRWEVRIQVGAEVIKRPLSKQLQRAAEREEGSTAFFDTLKSEAASIAKDEGYDLEPAQVQVEAPVK